MFHWFEHPSDWQACVLPCQRRVHVSNRGSCFASLACTVCFALCDWLLRAAFQARAVHLFVPCQVPPTSADEVLIAAYTGGKPVASLFMCMAAARTLHVLLAPCFHP